MTASSEPKVEYVLVDDSVSEYPKPTPPVDGLSPAKQLALLMALQKVRKHKRMRDVEVAKRKAKNRKRDKLAKASRKRNRKK